MDRSKEQRIEAFVTALEQLAERFRFLLQERQTLLAQLQEQKQENQALRTDLTQLTTQYKALRVGATLSVAHEGRDIRETRHTLTELMKEVEQCIELIK
jgi:uncharacterized coiled-coil DUF342 family protein